MRELFIYYRADPAQREFVASAVADFQARLRARYPWLVTRLLRRPELTDGLETWMETYSADRSLRINGVSAEVQADIEQHALVIAPCLGSPRHVEVFVACAS